MFSLTQLQAVWPDIDLCRYQLPANQADDALWLLPVSGGADSSALAILLCTLFPAVPFKLLMTDTGAEDPEIYLSLERLGKFLGREIDILPPQRGGLFSIIEAQGNFLPSSQKRWCTRELKLVPFKLWLEAHLPTGHQCFTFVGIRSDEATRLSFTGSEFITEMPFVDLGIRREHVFRLLDATIGIPGFYGRRSRSGCSTCPFQRRYELLGLMRHQPQEFRKGELVEKLAPADVVRFPDNAVPLWRDTGLARNWHGLPYPASFEPEDSKETWMPKRSLPALPLFSEPMTGLFVAAEFYVHPSCGVWWQSLITFSTTLAGLQYQLREFWIHRLSTAEAKGLDEMGMRAELKVVLYYIEIPSRLCDAGRMSDGSYTWSQSGSYSKLRHLFSWAERVLLRAGLEQQANAPSYPRNDWMESDRNALQLAEAKSEGGQLVAMRVWSPPVEEVADLELDMLEEKRIPCPMCHI